MEEKEIITKNLYSLSGFAKKFEIMFLELTKKRKPIPEEFIETYLDIISEIDKAQTILKRANEESKNIFRASKRL